MSILRTVHLLPPQLSSEYIQEKIVCIRAHRERIFYVATQLYHGKLICHNYGQGGAGWTFLFGCVSESINQFEQQASYKNKTICVIGAGCYGLLTAAILAYKGYEVRIVAQDCSNISSDKAAGFFFPRPRKTSTEYECEIFRSYGIQSYMAYLQIIKGIHPFISRGPKLLPAYFGLDIDPGFGSYIDRKIVKAPEHVTINFGNTKQYQAVEYQTVFINPSQIMAELRRVIAELGVTITLQHITDFDELEEAVIFNCTGLGAKILADDKRIVPVQGHLITLKNQPPAEQRQYMINVKRVPDPQHNKPRDQLIYYAPKDEGILGITFIRGQDSLTANYHQFDEIIERAREYFGT